MDKNLSLQQTHRTGVVELQGYFNLHTDASVLTTGDSPDVTWVKTTTGVYTGTLGDRCKMIKELSVSANIGGSTNASAQFIEVGAVDLSSAGTIVLRTCAVATGAIADTGVALRVYYRIVGKNSTAK